METIDDQINRVAFALRVTINDEDQQSAMVLYNVSSYFNSVSALIESNDSIATTVILYPVSC